MTCPGSLPVDVLVVEDNFVLAIDLRYLVSQLGVASVRLAGNVADALALIAAQQPDYAFIDIDLGRGSGFKVADRLLALDVPFSFVTAYSDPKSFPGRFATMPCIVKPYSTDILRRHLTRGLLARG